MANKEGFQDSMRAAIESGESPPDGENQQPGDPIQGQETEPPGKGGKPDPKESSKIPDPEVEKPAEGPGLKEKLAEKGVDIADLYQETIPGTDITFGEAKDSAADLADVSRLKLDIQSERDQLVTQQTEERQQMGAVLQRLVQAFGKDKVAEAMDNSAADVTEARAAVKAELIRFRPELSDEAAYQTALDDMSKAARIYGIPRAALEAGSVGIQRAFLRLSQLEGYLETLRKPDKPKKQVRKAGKKTGKTGGKKPARPHSNRGAGRFRQQMEDALKE